MKISTGHFRCRVFMVAKSMIDTDTLLVCERIVGAKLIFQPKNSKMTDTDWGLVELLLANL